MNLSIKDSSFNIKTVRYDFTYDNSYDTTLSASDTATSKYLDLRYNTIIASVFLENDSVLSCSFYLYSETDAKNLLFLIFRILRTKLSGFPYTFLSQLIILEFKGYSEMFILLNRSSF